MKFYKMQNFLSEVIRVVVIQIMIVLSRGANFDSMFSAPNTRGGSRIFFRRGCTLLFLYFNTNKPHSIFCRIPVALEKTAGHPGGGGARTPCTLPLDPPLNTVKILFSVVMRFVSNDIIITEIHFTF